MYTTPLVFLPRFSVGRGVYRFLPDYCRRLGSRFVVVGGNKGMQAGLPKLQASLNGSSPLTMLAALPYGGACTQNAINRLAREIAPLHPDFLVGMGGGKAIDTAKGVANALRIPLISLPTLVSNCAPITALSVLYGEDGAFERFAFYDAPPELTLVDLDLAAAAPVKYLRAGMGDTLAKHLESTFSAREDRLGETMDHMSSIGIALSSTCYDPILQFGRQALNEAQSKTPGPALEICARSIILSAGLVSLMADDNYNCALAHAVCYGLQRFEHVERQFLHGDLVAYGALVQLLVDRQEEKARSLRSFLCSLGTPVSLRQMDIPLDRVSLEDALTEATTGPDMQHIPYPITKDMVFDAMARLETLSSLCSPAEKNSAAIDIL